MRLVSLATTWRISKLYLQLHKLKELGSPRYLNKVKALFHKQNIPNDPIKNLYSKFKKNMYKSTIKS